MVWGLPRAVQWIGLCASKAGGMSSIPDQGTKISHAGIVETHTHTKKGKIQYEAIYRMNGKIAGREAGQWLSGTGSRARG